jgi:hypothetical protein
LVDFDADGRKDVISGSWPGELYLFRGGPDGQFAAGENIKDRDGTEIKVGNASAVHAADWDGDGDLDLLVGNIQGEVHLLTNEGTPEKWAFGAAAKLEAAGESIQIPHGDAGPYVADWDRDGKLDLLVGSGAGSVVWYRNVGSGDRPELSAGKTLVPESHQGQRFDSTGESSGAKSACGMRAKICVTDWN